MWNKMNKSKILNMRAKGSYGYSNAGAIIEAIFELDKTMRSMGKDFKEVAKQQKYLWQTLDDVNVAEEVA